MVGCGGGGPIQPNPDILTIAKFGYTGGGAELAMLRRPGKQESMLATPSVAVPALAAAFPAVMSA